MSLDSSVLGSYVINHSETGRMESIWKQKLESYNLAIHIDKERERFDNGERIYFLCSKQLMR